MKDKILGGVFGLCVADALGVPVEFQTRETLRQNPVVDMRGYGTYNQPPGTWSDDTSMTLVLLDSLTRGLDYADIMQGFLVWLDEAKYTARDEVFDIGNTSRDAISRYTKGTSPLLCGGASEFDNGNGSLMRILPLAFYLHTHYGDDFLRNKKAVETIHNVSALTHAHKRSQIACGIYLSIAEMLMGGRQLQFAIDSGIYRAWRCYSDNAEYANELAQYARLNDVGFKTLQESEIRSSGYVVDTLEASIWCLLNTDSFESCILKAINLGGDTDTVAAIAGGLAGMYYGYEAIPNQWRVKIAKAEYITELCVNFYNALVRIGFEKISNYISYFETVDVEAVCRWETSRKSDNGVFTMPHPVYDDTLLQFITDVSNSGLMDYSYMETINKYGFDLNGDLTSAIDNADLELTKAVLTGYVRQERFCDGLWGRAMKEGTFLTLLRRLAELFMQI